MVAFSFGVTLTFVLEITSMNYHFYKASQHSKQAERFMKKALELLSNGNIQKAEHFMRKANAHTTNARHHALEAEKSQSSFFALNL